MANLRMHILSVTRMRELFGRQPRKMKITTSFYSILHKFCLLRNAQSIAIHSECRYTTIRIAQHNPYLARLTAVCYYIFLLRTALKVVL